MDVVVSAGSGACGARSGLTETTTGRPAAAVRAAHPNIIPEEKTVPETTPEQVEYLHEIYDPNWDEPFEGYSIRLHRITTRRRTP